MISPTTQDPPSREELANVEVQEPMGAYVRLDHKRQAISDIFLTRVVNDGGT